MGCTKQILAGALLCLLGVIWCNAAPESNSTAPVSRPTSIGQQHPVGSAVKTTLSSNNVSTGGSVRTVVGTRVRVQRSVVNGTEHSYSSEESQEDSAEIQGPKNPIRPQQVYPVPGYSSIEDGRTGSVAPALITPGGGPVVIGSAANHTNPARQSVVAQKYFGIDDATSSGN